MTFVLRTPWVPLRCVCTYENTPPPPPGVSSVAQTCRLSVGSDRLKKVECRNPPAWFRRLSLQSPVQVSLSSSCDEERLSVHVTPERM
ncbi:hypothetical protein FQA47_015262 [Oryzias melastigma]|uniref:Uncharacterized protein n=1 Tax=Oryzias melastigma TaxID=30732 RepID=A0A834CL90_ORYME|nr:hypothetical protein FQA47_015262 [Oryzias melastigma]